MLAHPAASQDPPVPGAAARTRRIDGLCAPAEVRENPLDRCGRLDAGNHTKAAAAAPARLDLDGEYPATKLQDTLWLQQRWRRVTLSRRRFLSSPERSSSSVSPSRFQPRRTVHRRHSTCSGLTSTTSKAHQSLRESLPTASRTSSGLTRPDRWVGEDQQFVMRLGHPTLRDVVSRRL